MALFELERFQEARAAFLGGKATVAGAADGADAQLLRRFQTWVRKCDAELDSASRVERALDLGACR